MKIAIVGGTGKEGGGLAIRWARAGHHVVLGSRDAARAQARAAELAGHGHGSVTGDDNLAAARAAEVVVLTVPYAAHADTLRSILDGVAGKPLVDVTVPLAPPKVSRVHIPAGRAAALEAQALVGPTTPVVGALHHVSHTKLADPAAEVRCDVLVVSDDAAAKATVMKLVADLGLRALDAGPLDNAVALEALTPVLIHLNKTYRSAGCGVVFTDV
jgi:NADPH-dependent F420 reductase